MNWLKGKKTYIIASLMVMVGIVQLATGDIRLSEFIMSTHISTILQGVGLSTLRAGVARGL